MHIHCETKSGQFSGRKFVKARRSSGFAELVALNPKFYARWLSVSKKKQTFFTQAGAEFIVHFFPFGAIRDIHINNVVGGYNCNKYDKALSLLKKYAGGTLDAITITGDISVGTYNG